MPAELATVTFRHTGGAEQAYGRLRAHAPDAPWLDKVVFVESHRHDHLVIRGTFAGHYLDIGDDATVREHDVEVGVIAGAIVGFAFGPAGFAVGLIAGGAAGARVGRNPPADGGSLLDEVRSVVPEGSSAIVLFGETEDVDAMEQALAATDTPAVRHPLTGEQAEVLRAAVASAPLAAARPGNG